MCLEPEKNGNKYMCAYTAIPSHNAHTILRYLFFIMLNSNNARERGRTTEKE